MAVPSRALITLASVAFVALAFAVPQAFAQNACPSNTTAITQSNRDITNAAGLPSSVMCWNPNDPNTGQAAGTAKLWLEQHATKGANISCLNADFAAKLQQLMQAVPGGPPTITSGYRSPADQVSAQASGASQVGPCGSYHQYGMAADFNNASKQTLLWMRQNAPRFGLTPIPSLRVSDGCSNSSTFCDPGHIQIAGSLPPRNQCGICSSNGTGVLPGGGTQSAIPDDVQAQQAASQSQSSPLSALSSFLKGLTSSNSQSQSQQTSSSGTSQGSAQCTPQYICSGSTLYYQPATCVSQVIQTCQYGCAGTVCATLSSTTLSTTPTDVLAANTILAAATAATGTASQTSDTLASYLSTVSDLANPISNPLTAVGSATPLLLNSSLSSYTSAANGTLQNTQGSTAYDYADTGSEISIPLTTDLSGSDDLSQQYAIPLASSLTGDSSPTATTFGPAPDDSSSTTTTSDIASVPPATAQTPSFLSRVLDLLKQALQAILSYLAIRFGA